MSVAYSARNLTIQYTQGRRNVGGFIGTEETKAAWPEPNVAKWCNAVRVLEGIAK